MFCNSNVLFLSQLQKLLLVHYKAAPPVHRRGGGWAVLVVAVMAIVKY